MQFPSDFGINFQKNIIHVTHPNTAAAIVYYSAGMSLNGPRNQK